MDSISLLSWYTKLLCRVRNVVLPPFRLGEKGEKKNHLFSPENKVAKKEKIEYHFIDGLLTQW